MRAADCHAGRTTPADFLVEGMVSFGQLLRELRTGAGLTQEELAQAAALSTRAVSDLERSISLTARKDTARLLADALHLSGPARAAFEAAARGRPMAGGVAAATRALPRDVVSFADRRHELRQVAAAAGPGGVFAIGGMAGVGKTAFAVRAAHQMAPLFPDGQIFLPLHAHAAGRLPVTPADALASLLQTIGIPPARIPPSVEARSSLWRDRLAGRQLLLLLDDAAGTDQIRPLLPGTGGILVLITSRTHLTALEDARVISLDTLPHRDACKLLAALAARPGLEPEDAAVAEIARLCGQLPLALGMVARQLCGQLPLALGMVARQLCHHPSWTPAAVAADLASARDRLALIHAENLSVAAALDRSCQDLSASEQRTFRLLGLHPGTDFDARAAAALAGISPAAARRDLEGLYDRYLLFEPDQGRYRFHELIREHARRLALAIPSGEQTAAAGRLLDYYLRASRAANLLLRPGEDHPASASAHTGDNGVPDSRDEAVAWLAAERLNLHAAVRHAASAGQPGPAIAIPAAMHGFLRDHGYWQQALALHHLAAAAARETGSKRAEARALTHLGEMHYLTDDYHAAATALSRALALYRELGDQTGQATALTALGAVQHATGNSHTAATTLTTALGLYRGLDSLPGQARALTELGTAQHALGDQHRAIACYQHALDICRRLGDRPGEADALTGLGTVQAQAGQHDKAAASHELALSAYRDLGDKSGEAETLNNLADALRLSAQPGRALPSYEQALAVATRIAAPEQQARALEGTGLCHLTAGNPQQAREFLQQAADLYARLGSPHAQNLEHLLRNPATATSSPPASPPP